MSNTNIFAIGNKVRFTRVQGKETKLRGGVIESIRPAYRSYKNGPCWIPVNLVLVNNGDGKYSTYYQEDILDAELVND